MRRPRVKRAGKFTPIPRYIRKQVTRSSCQICHAKYGVLKMVGGRMTYPRQCLDHLLSRRWLSEHGIWEHHVSNMLSVCGGCHSKKLLIEDKLFHGDVVGFLQGLRSIHFPVEKVVSFALQVGLVEFGNVSL